MIDSALAPTLQAAQVSPPLQEARDVHEACKQFEGLLLGMILKDSLRPTFVDEDASTGLDMFKEFCIEHVAMTLADDAPLGVADQLAGDRPPVDASIRGDLM